MFLPIKDFHNCSHIQSLPTASETTCVSSTLFALFLDDLELYLQDRVNCGIDLYELCIILLLFADDMVLIGNSPQDLQHSLNKLFDYCTKWSLEVNTDKTNVVVFRKRGPFFENEKWYYNNEELVIKDNFNYLGVTFNYTRSFVLNNQCLKGKSLRAMYTLINNIKKHQVKPDVALSLFDSFVAPILNYASPIWGFHKSKELELVHLKFCKLILGVRSSTSNVAVYGEFGRLPLYINRYVQIIKYWLKIVKSDNIILSAAYESAKERLNQSKKGWLYNIKKLPDDYGPNTRKYFHF